MRYSAAQNIDELSRDEALSKVRYSALGSLSMREHATAELEAKLLQKFAAPELINEVIDWLLSLDYLNDLRFAEIFLRAGVAKGRGPERIKQDLNAKGVSRSVVAMVFDGADVDWFLQASSTLKRKFPVSPIDAKERARQMRFLYSRGFSSDVIYTLLQY